MVKCARADNIEIVQTSVKYHIVSDNRLISFISIGAIQILYANYKDIKVADKQIENVSENKKEISLFDSQDEARKELLLLNKILCISNVTDSKFQIEEWKYTKDRLRKYNKIFYFIKGIKSSEIFN